MSRLGTEEPPEVIEALHAAIDRVEAGQYIADADIDAYTARRRPETRPWLT